MAKAAIYREYNHKSGIYAIYCPITNKIVYIGRSNQLSQRFRNHLKVRTDSRVGKWITEQLNAGLTPLFKPLKIMDYRDYEQTSVKLEKQYITKHLKLNKGLLNVQATPSDPTRYPNRLTYIHTKPVKRPFNKLPIEA